MEFRTLGPLDVVGDHGSVEIQGAIRRRLLCRLLVAAGHPVSLAALERAAWGDEAPLSARRTIQSHLSRLRGLGLPIGREGDGYRVDVPEDAVDAHRFRRLCEGDGLARRAPEELRRALGWWRGDAWTDLDETARVEEQASLGDLRSAVEERIVHCDLAAGHLAAATAEAGRLARTEPRREVRWALWASGLAMLERRADALAVLYEASATIGDAGLVPGPLVHALEAAVLADRGGAAILDELAAALGPVPGTTAAPSLEDAETSVVRPPTGTVTFLFSDVEGSTRLWDEHPEDMRVALERHDVIMQAAIEGHGGHVFTTAGDSFAAAFADHDEAASAAMAAQRALAQESWPAQTPVRVRMALHTGSASERDGDYFGLTPSVAARLMGAAHGGQVLVSATTNALLRDFDIRPLGVHRLKDLSEPQEVFQLGGGEIAFPPLRTLDRVRHNLPVTVGALMGRERAMSDITKLVDGTRLVTVVGAGGIGKTRLAVAVGAEVADRFDDGVWFCDLASVGDTDAVLHTVAAVLGTRQRAGRSLLHSIAEFARDRQLLLVLDNCEHVLDGAADVVDAVTAIAPMVRFVATSREGLGVDTEVTYQLGPLAVGQHGPAVELFHEAAGRVSPTRAWSEAEQSAIEQICRRLDGIPLAIELAAARTRALTPVEIEERLDDAFRTLRGERRSIDRHRTLQAAIGWSYDALDGPEQVLFDRMSVFAGSCDLAAIEAVCADDEVIEAADVLDLLDELVSKSLVVGEPTPSGATRYRLLEPLRQFAARRLDDRGRGPMIRSRHLPHYARWAEGWHADVWGQGTRLIERLDAEFANVRSAIDWAIETGDLDSALRIVRCMATAQFGWLRLEVGDWGMRALELDGADDHPLGPAVASGVATSHWWRGDVDTYAAYLERAESMTEYDPTAVEVNGARATFTVNILGDPDTARALYDRIEPNDAMGRTMLAFTRSQLIPEVDGEYEDVLHTLRRDTEETGSALIEIIANGAEAIVRLRRGEFGPALGRAREAVEGAHAIGARFLANMYVVPLGLAAAWTDAATPREFERMREALRFQRDAGAETDQWLVLVAAAAALRDERLAERIQRGLASSMWANSPLAAILPIHFPNLQNTLDSDGDPPTLNALVDDVMSVIDRSIL